MILCDAHCHYHFRNPGSHPEAVFARARQEGLSGAIVNGTSVRDWAEVQRFVTIHPWARAAYGVHPWWVMEPQPDWENRLLAFLQSDPSASVGETGLDFSRKERSPDLQESCFRRHWEISVEWHRPVSIHAVKAGPELVRILKSLPIHPRGFLLHGWYGPEAETEFFLKYGARFSFAPRFALPRMEKARNAFGLIPPDRIVLETDAPSQPPSSAGAPFPPVHQAFNPADPPAMLQSSLTGLAQAIGQSLEETARITTANWAELFGSL